MWLLPLGALGIAATIVADSSRRGWPIRLVLLGLLVFRNAQQTYFQRNKADNPITRGAVALESSLTPKDFLVSDGWDASNSTMSGIQEEHHPTYLRTGFCRQSRPENC